MGDALCDFRSSINTMALSSFKILKGFKMITIQMHIELSIGVCKSLWEG